MLKIAIVGAGMAGMEVARHLASDDVLVIDAAKSSAKSVTSELQWCEPAADDETWWPHE